MEVKITPTRLCGTIEAPPSKSYLHRLIIAAFLSGGEVKIKTGELSDDAFATIGAVKSLGAEIIYEGEFVTVKRNADFAPKTPVIVFCGESGSTLRFLMPVAAALGIPATFKGKGRLSSRPVDALLTCMNSFGKVAEGLNVTGKLQANDFVLDGSISSQYITGMLFALSFLGGGSLTVLGKEVSRGYVDITLEVLKKFGVKIEKSGATFRIKSGFTANNKEVSPEGDWSGAAFLLSLGAVTGDVTVTGLAFPSGQGDSEILGILKAFGAETELIGVREAGARAGKDGKNVKNGKLGAKNETGVRVRAGALSGITVDLENIPDLAQTVAAVAAFAKGKTTLYSADRLRLKESDRIEAIIKTLGAAGIKAEYSSGRGGTITIYGGLPVGAKFSGGGDHRTVMSAAVLAAGAEGVSEICGAEAAAKSYPEFFNDMKRLGGKADVLI